MILYSEKDIVLMSLQLKNFLAAYEDNQ